MKSSLNGTSSPPTVTVIVRSNQSFSAEPEPPRLTTGAATASR